MPTRFMAALVIIDAAKDDILPALAGPQPEMTWDPTVALIARIEAGEAADGIFAIDGPLQRLAEQGIIDPATITPVVQASFGFAIGTDVSPPPVENAEDLRALLLAVPSICYSRAGASGIYFETLIARLGIAEAVRAKSLVVPAGLTGEAVRDGKAALAVQQMSELLAVKGIGAPVPLPPDCQQTTDFSAALFRNAQDPDGARAIIAALVSESAREAYRKRGLAVRF